MKNNYFNSLIFGIMCWTINTVHSQNILFDGDFSLTTEIIPFDTPPPPINKWASYLNSANGVEANPTVVGGVLNYQITNPGNNTWEVQLAQWGFPLILGHSYQLLFDVKADSYRSFGVFLGEEEGNWVNLIGYDRYFYNATTEWQTISIEFEAFSVFPLHKLSFELGSDNTTTYFDNVILQDLGPAPPEKVVIVGTFQSALNCADDWDPKCELTELTLNSSTGLYTGTFQIPAGSNRYKVTVGGSWDINYGENGLLNGPDIFLCVSSASEEITFTYDPATHLVTTSPISSGFSTDCLPLVVLAGSFQDETGCTSDWAPDCPNTALTYNSTSGLFEGALNIPTGCYEYRVVLDNSWQNSFGQEGIYDGPNYIISIPENPEITHFTYNPVSHIVSSTPYSDAPQEVTKVSLYGTLQDELGCAYDYQYECKTPALTFNSDSSTWEGNFTLPAGCYTYQVMETFGCNTVTFYGEDGIAYGNEIQLYVPSAGEITFSYDPQTHIISSTPDIDVPQEVTKVSLIGSLQDELGCDYDYQFECDNPTLLFNSESNAWEGNFTLPAGCYTYWVKETFGCNTVSFFGEDGIEWGNQIQLYVPTDGEITFSYDPQTHIISSSPDIDVPQEVTRVSLYGSLQDELGCDYDYQYECDNPALEFNSESGAWEGSYMLPAGCYAYRVKEIFGCNDVTFYGENGIQEGIEIQLYVPSDSEITFSYDPQTHIMSSSPYSGAPEELTTVSLIGTLQDELGCAYDFEYECDNPALVFNPDSNVWEGSFTLPTGCYTYLVKEKTGCNIVTFYGENGNEGGEIQLYVPSDGEITFSFDPETHIVSSTPFSGVPQDVTKVYLFGSLQDELGCAFDYDFECESSALLFNPDSGAWEGSFTLPAGCYYYWVKEDSACNFRLYGGNGTEGGSEIEIYVPSDGEITFSYNPETHIMTSSTDGLNVTAVSLLGTLQNEVGCAGDYDYECNKPELQFNPESGDWEGSFTLPAGCYSYYVKETSVCNVTFYGENGIEWGTSIQLLVPSDGEITFKYNPQTKIINSTPFSGAPQELTNVSLYGSLQDEFGCAFDFDTECKSPALLFNATSGVWEGSFILPAGCYTYWVKETIGCSNNTYYGENGTEWGDWIQLFVPTDGEVTFSYDPKTHILISTPFSGAPQEVTKVSLYGSLQDEFGCAAEYDYECDNPALLFNAISGVWEGSFILPAGCYTYWVKETIGCNNNTHYGENGIEYGDGIQIYIPSDGEVTFSYDPETHIIISTPFSGAPQELTKVSLYGSLQDEFGCASEFDYGCDNPALLFNPASGVWEGSFILPAGCYTYLVKETIGCNYLTFYGENGIEYGDGIQIYIPSDGEVTFSYDPQTHIISSTPDTGIPTIQCPDNILVNNSPGECGAIVDYPEFVVPANCEGEIFSITQIQGLPSGSFFPVGITTNLFLLTNTTGEEITCSFDVVVNDTEPPVISDLNQNYEPLWPANHKMVSVFIDYFALDNCNITNAELYVSSNEPENGLGDGDQAPDWEIIDEHNVLLRAERSGKGNGREYYITIKVSDSSGNYTEQFITVTVPHDNGKMTNSEPGNNKYTLYPNATDDMINIKGPKPFSNSAYVIYDMLGVMKKQGIMNNEPIEVRTLPSGVYIFKFETAEGYIFKKFIKN